MNGLVRGFKALSEPTRLRMLGLLWQGELCVCEVMAALGLSEPRASRNLGILKEAGLLRDRRQGRWVYYSLDREALDGTPLGQYLREALEKEPQVARDQEALRNYQACCPPRHSQVKA